MVDNVNIYDIDRLHKEIIPSLLEGDAGYQVSLAVRLVLSSELQKKVLSTALEAVKDMLVVKSSMMWALCPKKEYAVAKEKYLSDPALKSILDECEYYSSARAALPNTLKSLMADGVTVHTIAFYNVGFMMPNLFGSEKVNADDLLTPDSSAFGTTSANLGETLGIDYVSPHTYCSNPAHNHLSPDGILDAYTCALPENTWFFKDANHTEANSREDVKNFAAKLILDDSITDVYTCEGYSQFIVPEDHAATASETESKISYYDENGNVVNGDQIIYLYARYMQERKRLYNDEVVTTVMTNMGTYKALDKLGIKYHATPVGDKNVREYMSEHGNLIGGEQSGHIIFSKYATTGDGLLTAIKVMQVMTSRKKSLGQLVADCPMYPQVLINIRVSDKTAVKADKEVWDVVHACEEELGSNGRVLVRESGTEPLIRVMVEAETQEMCEEYANRMADVIRKKYEVK